MADVVAERAVVVDTETTGIPYKHDSVRVVEVAVVDLATAEVLANTRVNPALPGEEYHIPRSATRIHGIRDADVAAAPDWGDVRGDVIGVLNGAREVWAYNADFDYQVLALMEATWCAGTHAEPLGLDAGTLHCAMLWFADIWCIWGGTGQWSRLEEAAGHYGHVWTGGPHGALADALAARTVVLGLQGEYERGVPCSVCGQRGQPRDSRNSWRSYCSECWEVVQAVGWEIYDWARDRPRTVLESARQAGTRRRLAARALDRLGVTASDDLEEEAEAYARQIKAWERSAY